MKFQSYPSQISTTGQDFSVCPQSAQSGGGNADIFGAKLFATTTFDSRCPPEAAVPEPEAADKAAAVEPLLPPPPVAG